MKILISTGLSNSKGRSFSNFESANLFCRGLLGRVSNLEYFIKSGSFERSGTVDMEPVSFHARHKNRILSGHLATFSQNVLKDVSIKKWPFKNLDQKERILVQDHFCELLSILPDTAKF